MPFDSGIHISKMQILILTWAFVRKMCMIGGLLTWQSKIVDLNPTY